MKKVGYNAFLGTNFGSVLQAFALYTQVKKFGFDCELLGAGWYLDRPFPQDIEKVNDPKEYDKKLMRLNFEKFIRNNFSISLQFYRFTQSKISKSKVLQESLGSFDAFLCGSDQVWNPNQFWFKPENYLQFAERSKRVSYAPSIGYLSIPTELEVYIPTWREWLGEIDYLSVRESSSSTLIQKLISRKPEVVIDPTLLLTPEDWLTSLKKPIFSEEIRKILDSN